jgi:hypothetical protein
MAGNLIYTYAGIVESNKDPMKMGRLKVRVPTVFGVSTSESGFVGLNDLPWAMPAGMPAGESSSSGGFSHLPEPGDAVWVRFLDGEPEKPIWEWGMQTKPGSEKLALHKYDIGIPVGPPIRAAWTRYNHAVEMNLGSIILITSAGYRLVLTDSTQSETPDGNITVITKKGNLIKLNDEDDSINLISLGQIGCTALEDFTGTSNNFNWRTLTGNFNIYCSGGAFEVQSSTGAALRTAGALELEGITSLIMSTANQMVLDFSTLKLGEAATEAIVLGNRLVSLLTTLLTWLDTHVHTSASPGSPTSPPMLPASAVVQPQLPEILSTSILVRG